MCFPKGLNKNYKEFNNVVKPNAISLDYDVNPVWIKQNLTNVVLQGGLDPNLLLSSQKEALNSAKKYLDIFKNSPYIFNLGHGLLPETDPDKVSKLIKFYREY
jgi:uroporphyrinogen decarboxylase